MVLAWVSLAAAASATMQLERSELSEGQTAALQLIVTDGQVAGVPEIRAPEGLQIRYRSQSVQSYMVNFKTSTSVVYQYDLSALRAGSYTVGPLALQSNRGALQVPAVKVVVRERQAQGALDRVTASLPSTLWAGQVAVYRMQFQTDRNLVNAQWTPPDLVGLAVESALQPVTEESRVVQDGKTVIIEDLYYPVRAQSPGRHTVPGGVLQGQFAVVNPKRRQPMFGLGGFGEVSAEIFSSQPIPVEVKPLPAGAPAGFSGLVGQYTLTATPSATTVAAGGTVTIDLRLRGDGPVSGLKLPPLQAEGFRVYDDQPTWTAEWVKGADGKATIAAEAVFKRAIVPQSPGDLSVSLPSFAYFDPASGQYATASAAPITLKVTGDAGQAEVKSYGTAPATPVDVSGEDILPMRTQVRLSRAWTGEWAWGLLLPGVGLLLAQALPGLRARLARPAAAVEERPGFDRLPADPEARLAELDRILRLSIARRLDRRPDELHREHLAELGELAEEALEIYRAVEAARYRGGGIDEARLRRLVDALGAR